MQVVSLKKKVLIQLLTRHFQTCNAMLYKSAMNTLVFPSLGYWAFQDIESLHFFKIIFMRRIIIGEKLCIISLIQKINYVLIDKKFKAHHVKYFLFEALLQDIVCKYVITKQRSILYLFEIYFESCLWYAYISLYH